MTKTRALGLTIGLLIVVLIAAIFFHSHPLAVLQPAGPIASQEKHLIVTAFLLMLIVVVPVFVLTFSFAWKYRASNTKARYTPNWDGNRAAEAIWWLIPSLLILVLSLMTWHSTHALDPFKPLTSTAKPLTIQVVALDWKWLFIYPEQHIATVNYVEFPVERPITFQITADAPMNSFWIPRLSGQIYAMPGMSTELHLAADRAGTFRGSSANISGTGFATMHFTARAASTANFTAWVQAARQSPQHLTVTSYETLLQPSQNNPVAYYGSAGDGLYDSIIAKYMIPGVQIGDAR